uniref:RSN1_7TM domain-containing protein n=1 Tax=Ascaris lumbricoides TaxID=6252 RepID=A0A0M3I690_ASCLU
MNSQLFISAEYMNALSIVRCRALQFRSEPIRLDCYQNDKLASVTHASLSTSDLGRRYLCGLLRLSSAYFVALSVELLALVQMALFTFINYLHGFERYYELNAEIGKIIHFPFLLPLLIFQVLALQIRLEWQTILLIILPSIFVLAELYCIYITFACFRWLVHKKKSVRATGPDKAAQIDVVEALDSYSRRSTAIVNDDYLYIPT